MKKYLTLIIFCLTATGAFGQLERVFQNQGHYCNQMFRTTSGDYVLLNDNIFFMAVDTLGNTLFTNVGAPLPGNPHYESTVSIFEMAGNTFGAATSVYNFDTISGNGTGYSTVVWYDQGGNYTGYIENGPAIDKGIGLSGGDFVIADAGFILRYKPDGLWVWTENPPGNLIDIIIKPVDTLLLLTSQGLVVMDEHGDVAAQYPSIKHERIKTNPQGGFVCVQGDTVLTYSSDYGLVAQQHFSGDEIKDFDVANGKIAVLTESDSVYVLDNELLPIGSFQLVEDAAVFSFISVGNQTATLAGTEHYGSLEPNVGTYAVFLKEYGFDGNDFGASPDIGVVGINPVQEVEVQQYGPNNYWLILQDVEVAVKNFGDNTVSSFLIGSNIFENIDLQSGTEQNFIIPEIKLHHNGGYPGGLVKEFCVFTSHPDFWLDADASNDLTCADFLVSNKEVEVEQQIKLYPNPVTQVVNIQLPVQPSSNNTQLRILDAVGRVMEEVPTREGTSFTLSVSDWAAGIYFLQVLQDGAVSGSEKFIVAK